MQRLIDLERRMPELPEKVLAGVSGGADSVALVHLLRMRGCEVSVVHVNHALRGEASDGDEAFVRSLCDQLEIPLAVYHLQPPSDPGEDWARRERYRCFREAAAQFGAQALVLAHHRDDQAETLLLHLLRGAGLTGLTGMATDVEISGLRIMRPLLAFTRQELRTMLEQMHQPWREDASNQDPRYLRNALRSEVLPLLERLAPGSAGRLAETAALLRDDEDTLERLASVFLAKHTQGLCMELTAITAQTDGQRRRILRRWWQQQAGQDRKERSLSREQTETLAALIDAAAGKQCNLPGGWHGYRGWTHLHLFSPDGMPVEDIRLAQELPEGCVVRTRQRGDWLQTRAGRRSLQNFFTDRKVDAPFRDRIPLLVKGSEVLAVAGVWHKENPVRWQGDMPWQRQATNGEKDKGD